MVLARVAAADRRVDLGPPTSRLYRHGDRVPIGGRATQVSADPLSLFIAVIISLGITVTTVKWFIAWCIDLQDFISTLSDTDFL